MHLNIVLVCVVINLYVCDVFAGECCRSYTDITGDFHSPQWCSDFCCYDPSTLGLTYYCCESTVLQAPDDMRDSFCVQWWAAHVYVPILIGVAFLVLITGCCCCCCCGCCRRQSSGVIVQHQAPSGPTIMVQQQQQQQMSTHADPYRAGYNQ